MIKELIFAGKRWVELTYIGKTMYCSHNAMHIPAYNFVNGKMVFSRGDSDYSDYDGFTIKAQKVINGEYYFQSGGYADEWVKLSDLKKNGGVSSSPLTHLYQAFKRAFTRNEVRACL